MDARLKAFTNSDYYSALADYGMTHEEFESIDLGDIAGELTGLRVALSEIHGDGIFTDEFRREGDHLCFLSIGSKTERGRTKVNHSPYPNSKAVVIGENVILVAIRPVQISEEVTVDYRDLLGFSCGKELMQARRGASDVVNRACDTLFNIDHINNMQLSERILAVEHYILKFEQVDIPPVHEFINGMYRREITFPAGTLATGKIHTADHMDVMLTGEMLVATDDGFKHLIAPLMFTSRAGNKKCGYAISDVTWVTYHPTFATTVEDVEAEILVDETKELELSVCQQ